MNTQIRRFVFFSLVVTFISFETKAQQRFKAGIKAGLSTSQVDGDTYSGYNKAGFIGGAFIRAQLNEKWTAQFEIVYIQKGAKHNANPEKGNFDYYYLGLNYVEVPVLFQYHQKKFTYELGPGFGYLIKEEELFNFQNLTGIYPFNKSEIGINVGVSYTILTNLDMNWRYSYSITPARPHASGATRWYNPGQMNNVLSFTLMYQFGGGKTE